MPADDPSWALQLGSQVTSRCERTGGCPVEASQVSIQRDEFREAAIENVECDVFDEPLEEAEALIAHAVDLGALCLAGCQYIGTSATAIEHIGPGRDPASTDRPATNVVEPGEDVPRIVNGVSPA